jgi:chromosome segregation ATPase
MVLKNIQRIKSILPEVLYTVMFYDDGTVYHTNFEKEVSIPKLGENLSGILQHFSNIYDLCNLPLKKYEKLIFETDDYSFVILRLGESSNIALVLKKEEIGQFNLRPIKRYIEKIEDLIDAYDYEVLVQEMEPKLAQMQQLQNDLQPKLKKVEELNKLIKDNAQLTPEQLDTYNKELNKGQSEINELQKQIDVLIPEIKQMQDEIDKLKKDSDKQDDH